MGRSPEFVTYYVTNGRAAAAWKEPWLGRGGNWRWLGPGFFVRPRPGRSLLSGNMSAVEDLRRTVARLRAPGGCPWDQEQTHQSLAVCLIEECAELLDTIDRLDMAHMREELGDVLIQVVFHAQLAEEKGLFDLEGVAREINEKLIRRHPHVFGTGKLDTAEQVVVQWEQIKATEKKNGNQPVATGVFKRQPPALPTLLNALEVYKQIHKKKLPAGDAIDEARVQQLATGLTEAQAGKMIFELAAACRQAGIDPESALRRETSRITQAVEQRVAAASPAQKSAPAQG